MCVPGGNFSSRRSLFLFRQYNLADIRTPGDLTGQNNLIHHCHSFDATNSCHHFIEYDGDCIHVGVDNNTFPWNLTTTGQTILSLTLIYPNASYNVHNLVLPFFGWNTNCTVERDGSLSDIKKCTTKRYHIFEEITENPFIVYQVEPGQLTLAEVRKEVHVNSRGIRTEVYPTTFVNFPFTDADNQVFDKFCHGLDLSTRCDVIFFAVRSVSQVSHDLAI